MSQNFPNNVIYELDNLEVLRGMNSETIDLIATDPPYNTGGSRGAYNDSWADFEQEVEFTSKVIPDLIELASQTHGKGMAGYLTFLAPRLIEMHRILKPTGSLYVQCDHTAGAYIKLCLDAIFGAKNFRNEISWLRTNPKGNARRYATVTDTIYYYTKSKQWVWNPYYTPLKPETKAKWYVNDDGDGRGRYNRLRLSAPGLPKGDNTWRGIRLSKRSWNAPTTGVVADVIERDYIPGYSKLTNAFDRLDALDAVGLIHWPEKEGGIPSFKQYESMEVGVAPCNLFDDLPFMRDLPKERTGSPDQKPLALYERIIKASSNEGDVVLDPFAGSGTTLIAARDLGRRFVGIDKREDFAYHLFNRFLGLRDAVKDEYQSDETKRKWWLAQVAQLGIAYSSKPPIREVN